MPSNNSPLEYGLFERPLEIESEHSKATQSIVQLVGKRSKTYLMKHNMAYILMYMKRDTNSVMLNVIKP